MSEPQVEPRKPRGAGFDDRVHLSRPRKSKLIGVHCTERMVAAIERYIVEEQQEISRPEAIRQILRNWLMAAGYYK